MGVQKSMDGDKKSDLVEVAPGAGDVSESDRIPIEGALEAARALRAEMPTAVKKYGGDLEGYEWWEKNQDLLDDARKEWGMLHPGLYKLDLVAAKFVKPAVQAALADGSPDALRSVLQEVCRDSQGLAGYALDLFTDEFCDLMLEELDHLESSGIPLRRPNGMNRYGAILSQLGFQDGLLKPLMLHVVKPFSRLLWPQWVAESDLDETYGFVVRYRIGEDVDLDQHADTSNVTLNVCLGREFSGGDLYFKGVRFTDSAKDEEERLVTHRKGVAILHLGGHFHGVHPITSGERSNLVLWGTGDWGFVRIRPDF